jgi:hypothetical protein
VDTDTAGEIEPGERLPLVVQRGFPLVYAAVAAEDDGAVESPGGNSWLDWLDCWDSGAFHGNEDSLEEQEDLLWRYGDCAEVGRGEVLEPVPVPVPVPVLVLVPVPVPVLQDCGEGLVGSGRDDGQRMPLRWSGEAGLGLVNRHGRPE